MTKKNTPYIWGLDLSLTSTGGAIFNFKGKPEHIFSIQTDSKMEYGCRLKTIVDHLLIVKKEFPTSTIVLENGFFRFVLSTEALYRVQGAVMYAFSDCNQIFYPPSTVKKTVAGKGTSKKEEVQRSVLDRYPDLVFANNDESDAVAVGLTYFIKNNII